jgi:predicted  nucleic acid-binding Zn-ribbon protein
MKTADYINSLIKERDDLRTLCKSNAEMIRLQKQEISKLNGIISKKDKKLQEVQHLTINANLQEELNIAKNDLNRLRSEYADLQSKYDNDIKKNEMSIAKHNKETNKIKSELNKLKSEFNVLKDDYERVVKENAEYKCIFDEVEHECDSE